MTRFTTTASLIAAGTLGLGLFAAVTGTQNPVAGLTAQPAIATSALADEFAVDGVHSSVVFKIKHGGVSYFYGSFAAVDGKFRIDINEPSNTVIDVAVDTGSVNSNNTRRDGHLKSPDFFNADQFPKLTFKSTGATSGADGMVMVTGDLSYRGQTKSITVPVDVTGEAESRRGMRQGFHSEFTFKRSDFGGSYGIENGSLGDEVTIIVSLQGVRG